MKEETMTGSEVQEFVTRFAAAWASRDGAAFAALWHEDDVLHYPPANRPIAGREIARLNEVQNRLAPDLVWQLLDWTARGDVVVVEWQSTPVIDGRRFDFLGVDRFRLEKGRIREERVYMDTAPLRAARSGEAPEPLLEL
jgi:ketosteroid isomerase-like protein